LAATVSHSIDSDMAKEIAKRFFQQCNSVIGFKQAVLQDDIWTVAVFLFSSNDQMRQIRIDAKTGKIIDWSK